MSQFYKVRLTDSNGAIGQILTLRVNDGKINIARKKIVAIKVLPEIAYRLDDEGVAREPFYEAGEGRYEKDAMLKAFQLYLSNRA